MNKTFIIHAQNLLQVVSGLQDPGRLCVLPPEIKSP